MVDQSAHSVAEFRGKTSLLIRVLEKQVVQEVPHLRVRKLDVKGCHNRFNRSRGCADKRNPS
jgi:hypothetical protein